MASMKVLIRPSENSQRQPSSTKLHVLRRPGVPTTLSPTDWTCKRISYFTVNRPAKLIGFGLYTPEDLRQRVNVEISLSEFHGDKQLANNLVQLQPSSGLIQYVQFASPVSLQPGQLYQATAYYHQFVQLYLKSDPFQSQLTCSDDDESDDETGKIVCRFQQKIPKGSYRADCYPTEIPELIFV